MIQCIQSLSGCKEAVGNIKFRPPREIVDYFNLALLNDGTYIEGPFCKRHLKISSHERKREGTFVGVELLESPGHPERK